MRTPRGVYPGREKYSDISGAVGQMNSMMELVGSAFLNPPVQVPWWQLELSFNWHSQNAGSTCKQQVVCFGACLRLYLLNRGIWCRR